MIESAPWPDRTRCLVLLAVGGLGVSAVMTQLALMRELLGAFSGNELVFGISLGSWLLLSGAGTWLGRFLAPRHHRNETSSTAKAAGDATPSSRDGGGGVAAPVNLLIVGLICVAIIPLMQVVAVRVLRDVVFIRGAAVGVVGTVLGSLALLLPFCVVSAKLRARAESPEVKARVEASTAEFHAHQITQRPAFVLTDVIGDKAVFSGLVRAEPIAAAIEAMLADTAAYAAHAAHFGQAPPA